MLGLKTNKKMNKMSNCQTQKIYWTRKTNKNSDTGIVVMSRMKKELIRNMEALVISVKGTATRQETSENG